jgi:HrpA-like RNA helicase
LCAAHAHYHHPARSAILDAIKEHPTVIIIGETGSGKTTQIPQYLLESRFASSNLLIGVTQPRRVAAINLARRVALESGTRLGCKVGYSVRFDENTSNATKIKYMTDGMLLRELLSDDMLSRYAVIVLDEAHERTLRTDILFAMLKRIQEKRKGGTVVGPRGNVLPELKIVIMSATLDPEKFSSYFNQYVFLYTL